MNFRVQRTGNLVDVVDQDGSEYTGIVINEEQYGSETEDKAVPARLPAANAGADVSRAPAVAIRSTAAQRGRASLADHIGKIRTGTVHLIDELNAWHTVLGGLTPNRF